VNLHQYLALKESRAQAAAELQKSLRQSCAHCRKTLSTCYCAQLRPFEAPAHVVILIHPMENRKRVGTGRMTHLSIANSTLIEGVDFTDDERVNSLIADSANHCVTVYPGEGAADVSEGSPTPLSSLVPDGKNLVLFLIDGTWFCAEKMLKVSHNLMALPQIKFTPPHHSIYAIRRQPSAHCFSTIETAHFLLGELGCPHRQRLIDVFRYMIDQQIIFGGAGRKRAERGARRVIGAPCTPSPSPSTAPSP
jgi:DTW domain-containing protein YfiP